MIDILVIDDDKSVRYTLKAVFQEAGYAVRTAADGREGIEELRREAPAAVVTDLSMRPVDGMEVLRVARAEAPNVPVIMITAHGSERRAVEAMKDGAWDYLSKPFDVDEMTLTVRKALERHALSRENTQLRAQVSLSRPIVYRSAAMGELMTLVHRVARRNVNVLVTGETGTGKELVAQAVHELSDRAHRPFVPFNCATLAASLAESELFGHERGAFTGAHVARLGLFGRAEGGTLFLDEIGEMPLELQPKLLRAVQDGQILPLGSALARRVDVRVIAATNRDLRQEVAEGRFREDLYYRLNVVCLRVPPLRERAEDVVPLIHHFIAKYVDRYGVHGLEVSPEVISHLGEHAWPGNVRDLENAVSRLIALSDGETLTATDLVRLDDSAPAAAGGAAGAAAAATGSLRDIVAQYEAQVIREALDEAEGNQTLAARRLAISRVTLLDKIKKHGLR
ncbi:MAG: sigma-54-dependent Fis family transcriptional regulator [Candidatus Schekmanbacteria bacterium]|nr:sigma-54-dependent Fis family transcriptional regulator [Candidatus Schekmanbacteria bacterium]